ncbi:unnamed protein product [Vitrella brassicaformis CCMP3155]|uniref:UBC core domain-containing protein n=1 Tax=Vitrella brassicaformis (strain CCMP3155) TaxID=1169540 RepID=A0A0G4EYE5_VITBC|nr:unnamed protein product [Vitrella brassicaformis CCMP3155]|mmetsp:Transcript_24785/g.71543  ORF Transcript_24785/g.71543 Transcript_24785/m.71543 type:complete len:335 (+) Transcript_24785:181-1185(+)|eukprot:CEM03470.1 unnamed protein product [Vitrella brassicaformis CCMP3155]
MNANRHTQGNRSLTSRAQSIARILREQREMASHPSSHWYAAPIDLDDPYEWHFTLKGPDDTDFQGGMYHGRILLPQDYPFSPPSLYLLTPNGRFEVGKKICLSASSYHPELWQPAWGIRTILEALRAFFPTPGDGAIRSLDWDPHIRRKIAKESGGWVCPVCKKSNREIIESNCPAHDTDTERPPAPCPIKFSHEQQPNNKSNTTAEMANATTTSTLTEPAATEAAAAPGPSPALSASPAPPTGPSSGGHRVRRRPPSLHRGPVVWQLIKSFRDSVPRTRLDLLACGLDCLMLFLLGCVVVLLIELMWSPPLAPKMGSGQSGGAGAGLGAIDEL